MVRPDSLKIVHVPRRFAEDHWGGTESVLLSYCDHLTRLGQRQQIYTSKALQSQPVSYLRGVEIRRFGYFYPYLGLTQEKKDLLDRKGGNLFSFSLGWALAREPGLDLIHLHTGKRLGGLARWVARRRRIPYVVSLHGGIYDVPTAEAESWTEPTQGHVEWGKALGWLVGSRRVLDDAALILCLGRKEQALLQEKHPRSRVEVFPNGVDPEVFGEGERGLWRQRCGLAEQDRLLLCVGRIDPQKNQEFALRLLARLPGHYHLLLLGSVTNQEYLQRLQRLSLELGVGSRVHGWTAASGQDLVNAYKACDLFFLPSLHEPFGIVVLEAWAAGRPVLASAVGGLCDLIRQGETGWLFPSGNLEEAEARVLAACEQPEQMAGMRARCQKLCREQYAWSALAARLTGLYGEVLSAHSGRQ